MDTNIGIELNMGYVFSPAKSWGGVRESHPWHLNSPGLDM
jgi:hypothetical protein